MSVLEFTQLVLRVGELFFTEPAPPAGGLYQYGAIGILAAVALYATFRLSDRLATGHDQALARERERADQERERADRLEAELREQNRAIAERYVITLSEATRAIAAVLEQRRGS